MKQSIKVTIKGPKAPRGGRVTARGGRVRSAGTRKG